MSEKPRLSKIRVGSYVSLKNGFDIPDFYRGVSAGATGWVVDSKVDEYGFPMVKIEWDEMNHNWSGEMDKWTFESHFNLINDGTDLNKDAEYIGAIRKASDDALASLGFIMITAKKAELEDGSEILMSGMYTGHLDPLVKKAFKQYIIDMAEDFRLSERGKGDD